LEKTMANEVFGESDFHWDVTEGGYQWVQKPVMVDIGVSRAKDRMKWVLTDGLAIGSRYAKKQYAPLRSDTGLFRIFASIPLTREGILQFANEYGLLGIGKPLYWPSPNEPKQILPICGETHQDWVQQIDQMRRAVDIWDMERTNDVVGLNRYIFWKDAEFAKDGSVKCLKGWRYDSHPDLPVTKHAPGRIRQLIEPVLDLFKAQDVHMPALFLIQRWINDHLEGAVSPCLLYDPNRGKRVLRFLPHNLLGAFWLQFAQAIDGDKEYRACRECGKWFEISLDAFRTSRVFCSDPCKSKDYRKRKDLARQLRAEGRSVKDIAKELDTDAETIKKWASKRKG
jgi:hypothetical protein